MKACPVVNRVNHSDRNLCSHGAYMGINSSHILGVYYLTHVWEDHILTISFSPMVGVTVPSHRKVKDWLGSAFHLLANYSSIRSPCSLTPKLTHLTTIKNAIVWLVESCIPTDSIIWGLIIFRVLN
jgi:hypothetical protein